MKRAGATIRETVDARKTRYGKADLAGFFKGAGKIIAARGKKTVTIPPGTYFFTDVKVTGGAILNVTGPTVIYLTGDNGASAEGTIHGAWSAPSFQNGVHEDPEWLLERIDLYYHRKG